jgi:branched-chain amino acid transport system substrate-binding protein
MPKIRLITSSRHLGSGRREVPSQRRARSEAAGLIRRARSKRAFGVLALSSLLGGGLTAFASVPVAAASHGTLTIGAIAPFTGSQSALGPIIAAPCSAAVSLINKAGGVLGHNLTCGQIDDYGDAADAVPNVSKALATNRSLVAISGIDSSVAATVVPIVNSAKLPMISSNGLSEFDTHLYPYFWRDTAPDLALGVAMGLWVTQKHYKRVALITENDVSDTGNLPGAVKALAQAKITVTNNLTIAGDASDYQSTLTRIIAGHPDALMISTDEQTLGTLLSEYKTLNGGSVPPAVTDTGIFDAAAFSAVKAAVNVNYLTSKVAFIGTYVDTASSEFAAYAAAVAASSKVSFPKAIVATGGIAALFDGITVMALAMVKAKSTSGPQFNKDIASVSTKRAGAVVIHSFAQGLAQLHRGHQIQYVGVTGPITFNKYHNSPGEFAGFAFTASHASKGLGLISSAKIAVVIK